MGWSGGGVGVQGIMGVGELEGRKGLRDPCKPCIMRVSHHAGGQRDALEPTWAQRL